MNTLMKKPSFKIEVKRYTLPTEDYYAIHLFKDGSSMWHRLIPCSPTLESIVEVGDLVMKLEAFTKYYIEDND
jgi:hypothetical protein